MKKSLIYVTAVFTAAMCLMVPPAKADQQAITVPDAGFDDHVLAPGDWVYIGEGPYAETSDYTEPWQSAGGDAYINEAGVTNSEGALPLTAMRDWTTAGIAELSLWFRGASDNAAEPMYMSASNAAGGSAVVAHNDLDAAQINRWTRWIVPLQALADQGITVTNVDKFAIGLGSQSRMAAMGGTGAVYIEDIRLNQPSDTAAK